FYPHCSLMSDPVSSPLWRPASSCVWLYISGVEAGHYTRRGRAPENAPAPYKRDPFRRRIGTCIRHCINSLGGLDLIGKAAVLKAAGRKPLWVRIPRPPLRLV